jgi:hypothetical protein
VASRANLPYRVSPLALVAPRSKVVYLATPKAACTTIKTMLAEAEGTHRAEMSDRLAIMHVSRAQTIHHPAVHGLRRMVDLPERDQREILASPEWTHIASVRDPVSRAYSAWENRIFMRAHRRNPALIQLAADAINEGRIDVVASFARFTIALGENADPFMADQHFLPQSHLVRKGHHRIDTLVHVDRPGEMDGLADLITRRSNTTVAARRLNEGLGIPLQRVCDQDTANRLMATYAVDYETFGFDRRVFEPHLEPLLLGDTEQRLLTAYRNAMERGVSVARESQRRVGARYGVKQVRRALQRFVRGERGSLDPREIQ